MSIIPGWWANESATINPYDWSRLTRWVREARARALRPGTKCFDFLPVERPATAYGGTVPKVADDRIVRVNGEWRGVVGELVDQAYRAAMMTGMAHVELPADYYETDYGSSTTPGSRRARRARQPLQQQLERLSAQELLTSRSKR